MCPEKSRVSRLFWKRRASHRPDTFGGLCFFFPLHLVSFFPPVEVGVVAWGVLEGAVVLHRTNPDLVVSVNHVRELALFFSTFGQRHIIGRWYSYWYSYSCIRSGMFVCGCSRPCPRRKLPCCQVLSVLCCAIGRVSYLCCILLFRSILSTLRY